MQLQSMLGNADDEIVDHEKLFLRWKELKPAFDVEIVMLETPSMFVTFNEDAILLAKTLKKGFLTYKGPEYEYKEAGISKVLMGNYLPLLSEAGVTFTIVPNGKPTDWKKLENDFIRFIKINFYKELKI